jgi:hypothetical protein
MRVERLLPLSGVAFVAVVLGAFLGGGSTPGSESSASKVAAFYGAHSTRHFVVAIVLAFAAPFSVLFATSVVSAAGRDDRRDPWRLAVLAGASVAAALFLVSALIHFALADAGNQGVGGGAIRALNLLDADTWIGFNAGIGVLMLTIGGLRMTAGAAAPRWSGWSALILGVALFIPFADFVALLLTGVWILVESFRLARRVDALPLASSGSV